MDAAGGAGLPPGRADSDLLQAGRTPISFKARAGRSVYFWPASGWCAASSGRNVPDNLPTGMSYREAWTGIPAVAKAVRAVYTVWPG